MHPAREGSGYRSLLTASFAALLVGQIISILGDRLNNIALVHLLATETGRFAETGSAFELSKLALAMTLPSLVLGPLVGTFVDRADRKRVLIVSDLVRGAAVLAIPFLRPALPLWTVYGVVAVLYAANLFFLPARCAIVSEMVDREHLIRANSMLSIGATLATVVGFGVGGVIAARAGWRLALFIDSATYFFSAGALSLIRLRPDREAAETRRDTGHLVILREAVREISKSRGTRAGVLAPPIMALGAAVAYVLGVAIIENRYAEGTIYVGVMVSLAAIGMALGCFLTGKLLHGASRSRIVLVAAPLALGALTVLGFTTSLALMGVGILIAGFAAGPAFVSSETVVQEEAPARRQATVFAVRDMLMKIGVATGASVAPLVATRIGFAHALVALLAVSLVAALFSVAYHSR